MDENAYKVAREALERRIEDLIKEAYAVVEDHWKVVYAEEKQRPGWKNASSLQLRARKVGNSIILEWSGVRWYGGTGQRRKKLVYIPKTRGEYSYSMSKLMAFAKDWEKPLVEQTEKRLAAIRREAGHIAKALQSIRHAQEYSASSVGKAGAV